MGAGHHNRLQVFIKCTLSSGSKVTQGHRNRHGSIEIDPDYLTLNQERKGLASWKLAGRKPMGDPWPHSEVERSKVKVTRPLNAVTENQPYLLNRKAYELQAWCTDRARIRALICAVNSNLRALGDWSSPHLQGAGYIVAVALKAAQFVITLCPKKNCGPELWQ